MKKIANLNPMQIDRIIAALEADGFQNIKKVNDHISFSRFPRSFELYSTNIHSGFNDDNLDITLDELSLFADKPVQKFSGQLNLNLSSQLKTRHSISLSQSDDSDAERAAAGIGQWAVKKAHYFRSEHDSDEKYFSIPDVSDTLLILDIKGKDHYALNHGPTKDDAFCVYEGSHEIFLGLVTAHPDDFLEAPNLDKTLNEINQEEKES